MKLFLLNTALLTPGFASRFLVDAKPALRPMTSRPSCLAVFALAGILSIGHTARAMEDKAFSEAYTRLSALRREDPNKVVAEARQIIDTPSGLSQGQSRLMYGLLASVEAAELKAPTAGLATIDEALAKAKAPVDTFLLFDTKARMLVDAKRLEEAESLLAEKLPLAQAAGFAENLRTTYVAVLQKRGKTGEVLRVLNEGLRDNLESSRYALPLLRALADQQLILGNEESAAGYAKLNFMLCPFDEKSTQDAMQLVVKVWTAKYLAQPKIQELIGAQQDPSKPNPLRDVKLPEITAADLQKRFELARDAPGRISVLIIKGDFKAAMVEARGLMLDRPASTEGVMQVCRVFKAQDLNLTRANAFLAYMKSGEGANPVTQFLQEQGK